MNRLNLYTIGSILLIVLASVQLRSQDIHYSQFHLSPANLNPGLTGAFNGDLRFVSNFKPQWHSVPVSYMQFTSAIDTRFFNKDANGPLAASLFLDYDQAGDSRLTYFQISMGGSYSINLDKDRRNYLTLGLTASAIQRSYDPYQLYFPEKWNPNQGFDPTAVLTEDFTNTKVVFGDVSTGINLHLAAPRDRSSMDVGLGVFHATEPVKSFDENVDVRLDRRYSVYATGNKVINSHFDMLVHGMGQVQGKYTEVLFGAGSRYFLVSRQTKVAAIDAGVSYRFNDAVIPYLGFHYNGWQITASYDVNLSQFKEATLGLGGLEISAIYIIADVPFKSYCPHCPAFL
ncbi:MAG: PorP/SprF family type IX secretion system membrane protein [Bacteroidota bacterium]